MSKQRKSHRKPVQQLAKKVAAPPIKAKSGARHAVGVETNGVKLTPTPSVEAKPVAVTQEREPIFPIWARMPFAVMDFWLSRTAPGHGKS
jgi:hypothetical protein